MISCRSIRRCRRGHKSCRACRTKKKQCQKDLGKWAGESERIRKEGMPKLKNYGGSGAGCRNQKPAWVMKGKAVVHLSPTDLLRSSRGVGTLHYDGSHTGMTAAHVKAHRTEKKMQHMSLFDRFIAEGMRKLMGLHKKER